MTSENMTDRQRWLALVVVCLGDLMIVLDVTIVGVALPSIREDLGFTESSLAWVANAYLLTFGGFLLLAGRLGDLFGHRRLFLIGIALFTLASLGCGLVTSQAVWSVRGRCRASAAPSSRQSRSRSSSASSPSQWSGRRRWGSSVSLPPAAARSASFSAGSSPRRSTGVGSSSSTSRSGSPSSFWRGWCSPAHASRPHLDGWTSQGPSL